MDDDVSMGFWDYVRFGVVTCGFIVFVYMIAVGEVKSDGGCPLVLFGCFGMMVGLFYRELIEFVTGMGWSR